MLKFVFIVILLAIIAVLIYAATKPDTFRIERSIVIKASADKIFSLINDLHQWEPWSPWEKIDPAVKRTYSGASSGVGAAYEWLGNRDVGHGRMEITESVAPLKVVLKLHFIKPFEANNTVEFLLVPDGGDVRVTQAMYGPSPFVSKLMSLVFSMDKMVGGKYEEGLASLKALAEEPDLLKETS